MLKTYFISGLGSDSTVFKDLKLHPELDIHHLPWLIPERGESIEHYAGRMLERVPDPSNSALVGLSFGGILSIEMNKLTPFRKTVIISSIKSRQELPNLFRWVGKSGLQKLVPTHLLMVDHPLLFYAFGIRTKEQRQRLKMILQSGHPNVFRWSIEQLLHWQNMEKVDNLTHIHGTHDRLFTRDYVHPDHWVEGGQHFMIVDQHEYISELLNACLEPAI